MASIREVAEEAGFAPATVSRYLNGHIKLKPSTQKKIEDAIDKLGYRGNGLARRLATGKSETLGFVTTDISYPFFASIASAAEREATRLGYALAVFNTRNDIMREMQILSYLQTRQLDGVIIMTNHTQTEDLATQITNDSHVVILDEDIPGAVGPRVFAENRQGGRLAARHFLENGHRSFAVISGPRGLISVEERIEGFKEELSVHGLSLPSDMIYSGPYSEETGGLGVDHFRNSPDRPTAMFATADNLCLGAIREANAANLKIPDDLSIIGFDDIPNADLLAPPLTTIRQGTAELGAESVRLMLGRLRGEIDPSVTTRIPVTLIERQSVRRMD